MIETSRLRSPERNVELIRRKNVEDNQLFLQQLRMLHFRDDFVKSARSVLNREPMKRKPSIQYEKIEHSTRYKLKIKSGEIAPHVPEWQRFAEQKRKDAEEKKLLKLLKVQKKKLERAKTPAEKRRMLLVKRSRLRRRAQLASFKEYSSKCNPYERTFIPRRT